MTKGISQILEDPYGPRAIRKRNKLAGLKGRDSQIFREKVKGYPVGRTQVRSAEGYGPGETREGREAIHRIAQLSADQVRN